MDLESQFVEEAPEVPEMPEVPYASPPEHPLAMRLRSALKAARGNSEIRRRLSRVTDDPKQLAWIRAELGNTHAMVLELLSIRDHTARADLATGGDANRREER